MKVASRLDLQTGCGEVEFALPFCALRVGLLEPL